MIQAFEITEGNLKAVKSTSDFGGPNMWNLYVIGTNGYWESVQWMGVYSIQRFFKATLPVYKEEPSVKKYELVK
jgi:hypothetical protein